MRRTTRNVLAVLILVLLVAGIASAFLHDNGGKATPTASGPAVPSTTRTTQASGPATTVASTPTTVASTPTTGPPSATTTPTSSPAGAVTQQPRTGGPPTLAIGVALIVAGLLALRVHAAAARAAGRVE